MRNPNAYSPPTHLLLVQSSKVSRKTPIPGTTDRYTWIDFNLGFHVRHYDLELDYRVVNNRLAGTATLTIDNYRPLKTLTRDMFDDRVYKRGAIAVHVLRRHMGDEAFFAALRAYVADGRHGVVEPIDLRNHLSAQSDALIDELLKQWIYSRELLQL